MLSFIIHLTHRFLVFVVSVSSLAARERVQLELIDVFKDEDGAVK